MRLFAVPSRTRVRIHSGGMRWCDHRSEETMYKGVIFEATTTNCYCYYKGAKRRLLINPDIKTPDGIGIWQSDKQCEIVAAHRLPK